MFIRRTQTRGSDRGESYFTHRLVRSERNGERVRHRTLLNLGIDFALAPEVWPVLCARVEQLIPPLAAGDGVSSRGTRRGSAHGAPSPAPPAAAAWSPTWGSA